MGNVKAEILKGDNELKYLIYSSIYDIKPVQLLSISCKEIKWVTKKKIV